MDTVSKQFLSTDPGTVNTWPEYLHALWLDRHGDWEKAHDLINDLADRDSARVHAYLHRKEGDGWNAGYWYRRAGVPVFEGSLEEEWTLLVQLYIRD